MKRKNSYFLTKRKEIICAQKITGFGKRMGFAVLPMFRGHMLDLIYTGHPDEALHLLDRVWAEDEIGRNPLS